MTIVYKRMANAIITVLLVLSLLAGCVQPVQGSAATVAETSAAALSMPATPTPSATAKPMLTASVSLAATPSPTATAAPQPSQWADWLNEIDAKMPPFIPVDKLFAPTQNVQPSLSPNGKYMLVRAISPDHSYDVCVIVNLQTNEQKSLPYPKGVAGIPMWLWAGDSKHVLLLVDNMGDENYGLYSVDIATGESMKLFHEKGVRVDMVAMPDGLKNVAFVGLNQRNKEVFDLYRIDTATGKRTLVMENPGMISDWFIDRTGALRGVRMLKGDGGEDLLFLKKAGSVRKAFKAGDWKTVVSIKYEDTQTSQDFGFSTDSKKFYYCDSSATDTNALIELNLQTMEKKQIAHDPGYDIGGVWHDLKKNTVTAVKYNRDRLTWMTLDSNMLMHIANLRAYANGDFDIVSSSDNDKIWLVSYMSDICGLFYCYYMPETQKIVELFSENPALQGLQFAPMEPMEYKTSDGLTVRGYATFPLGLDRKKLPVVLLVHGGPQARDSWGFQSEVQWLSNRGYMVLQVNFRGSTGFGKKFINLADKQWGAAMQQDLTDAVTWAVQNGYADPQRIAIMGGSYGGYAALAGAAFTPDLYACAIDMFGPSNLVTLLQSVPDYWKPMLNQMYRTIGNPNTEKAFLESRSPLFSVDKIKIPILIAQGGNDVRVKPMESQQIVDALKARGLPVEYLFFPNNGHGLSSDADIVKFYTTAEQFLAEHIGGRVS